MNGNQYRLFWTTTKLKALKILRLHGFSYQECAEALGTTEHGCEQAVYRYDLPRERRRTKEESQRIQENIVKMCGPGISDSHIAKTLGVDRAWVMIIRKRHDIPPGNGWGGKRIKGQGSLSPREQGRAYS